MGHTTDFIGHFDVAPALNQDKVEYLTAFSSSRRFARPEGPYAVPGNPGAAEPTEYERYGDVYNDIAPGQPQLWCQWVPCWDGCCLSFDGHEKFYQLQRWLEYLIEHFLKPGAAASHSGLPEFEHFTFDHRVEGMVVACRRDTRELFALEALGDRARHRVLWPGAAEYRGEPLAYEVELGRERAERQRRRRIRVPAETGPAGTGRPNGGEVVDLTARRRSS